MYVLYRYKTKQICDKLILENSRMFGIIPDWYKNKKIWKLQTFIYFGP